MSSTPSTSTTGSNTGLLVSLAMLRQDWNRQGRTWLDNFEPFVGDCLRQATGPGWSDVQIQEAVEERFGILIPTGALATILKRMARAGECTKAQRRYVPTTQLRDREPLDRARSRCEREHQAVTGRLQQFARHECGLEWTFTQADAALRRFVEDWAWALELMRGELAGRADYPEVVNDREAQYVVAQFVLVLRELDPDGYEWFMGVIRGSMLAAGMYLDAGTAAQKFGPATVYLDTPLLMDLLTGDCDTANAATELIELGRGLDLRFACFQHTATELRGVLEGTAHAMRMAKQPGGPRPGTRVLRDGLDATSLEDMAADLPKRLTKHHIAIERKPHWQGQPTTNETALERHLEKYVAGQKVDTRRYDVESLVSVHRFRKGGQPQQYETAKAFFVTTNQSLVRAAAIHFGTHCDPHAVPVAMTDHAFATLLWLKSPTPAPDLPWKQVLADCRAALRPSDALWQSYLDEIDRLQETGAIDENSYFVARYANEARRELMHVTRGNQWRLNEDTVANVVAQARRAIRAPSDEEAAQLRARMAEGQRLLELRERDLVRAQNLIEKTREEGVKRSRQVSDGRYFDGLRDGTEKSAERITHSLVSVVSGVVAAGFILVALLAGLANLFELPTPWAGIVTVTGFGIAALSGFLASFGGSIRSRVERWLRPHVAAWVSEKAGCELAEEDSDF